MANLDLPKRAATEKYSHENHDCDHIAVYTLTKLDAGSKELQEAFGTASAISKTCAWVDVDFTDSTLSDILEHHLEKSAGQKLHPTIFIVAHSKNYQEDGVLLIDANYDLKGGVDKVCVKTTDVVWQASSLQVGNIDWWDVNPEDKPDDEPIATATSEDNHLTTVFGAYGIRQGANMTKIRDLLEPGWLEKQAKTWLCESIGSYVATDEPLREVVKYHPWHCLRNSRMSRQWCICVDSIDPMNDGVLLLHIDWDGNMGREPKELLEIGARSDFRTERIDVGIALQTLTAKLVETDELSARYSHLQVD